MFCYLIGTYLVFVSGRIHFRLMFWLLFFMANRTGCHSKVKMKEQRTLLRLALCCSLQREHRRIGELWFGVSFLRRSAINEPNRRSISMSLENDSFLQAILFITVILYSLLLRLLSFFFHSVNFITMSNNPRRRLSSLETGFRTSPLSFKEFSA